MGKGFLQIQTSTAGGVVPLGGASITVKNEENQIVYEFRTDETGNAPKVALEAPDLNAPGPPFKMYKVLISAPGYTTIAYEGVMITDTSTSILDVVMTPVVVGQENEVIHLNIGGHKLYHTETPQQVEQPQLEMQEMSFGSIGRILPEVTIPNFVRVHLNRMEIPAPVERIPFIEYIKNVASHEVWDHWPEEALIANIYCIVSLTLNRIYTEFYRTVHNRNFDITSETYMDQKFVFGGIKGARISAIVDKIFNYYLAIVGHKEPFLALYNDGIKVNIPGRLSQYGSMEDAQKGMNAWQIIKKYYKQNLELRVSDRFGGILQSYPGYTLTQGTRGDAVRTMQIYLNRILGRHIPNFNPLIPDGVFGPATRSAVITYQRANGLQETGQINETMWYRISRTYGIEKALWEMYSEGIRIGIGTTPPTQTLRPGNQGPLVVELQFLLDFIAMYHSKIPFVAETSIFDSLTTEGVRAFQSLFGITADGVVGATTWRKLYDVYWGIMQNTVPPEPPEPPIVPPENIPPFPGVSLRVGSSGANVRLVQEAINRLAEVTPGLWKIAEDGIFGNGTRNAVVAFQRKFGLVEDGIVGVNTWMRLMKEAYAGSTTPQIPQFPGTNLSVGSTGPNVRLVQEAFNKLGIYTITVDGNFGIETRDAIFTFQNRFGLPITGVVNQATWDRLMQEAYGVSPPPPQLPPFPGTNLSVGSSGQNVRLVQEAFNKLGIYTITIDGNFGIQTRDAIFTFQNRFGLPITGVVNQATWDRLMQEAANVNPVAVQGQFIQDGSMGGNNFADNKKFDKMMCILLAKKLLTNKNVISKHIRRR